MVYMHARRFRPLSDLNLIDNFLFHKMIDDKEAGEEFCRILLRTILNKEIRHIKITPQKELYGLDTDMHGIRMDAYPEDIGGSGALDADILAYDPFSGDRMVYTIQNAIKEDPSINYDDSALKIILYTKGKVGNASKELQDMLKHFESSTMANVTNPDIEFVHQMVDRIKAQKEMKLEYMKAWEWDEYNQNIS